MKSKIIDVKILPVTDMVAYKRTGEHSVEWTYVIALKVTIYENGFSAWYPVSMNQLASEHIVEGDGVYVDQYWDWLEYKGSPFGINIDHDRYADHFPEKVFGEVNHFPDKVV